MAVRVVSYRKRLELLGRYLYKMLTARGYKLVFCRVVVSTNVDTPAMLVLRTDEGKVHTIDLPKSLPDNFRAVAHRLLLQIVSQLDGPDADLPPTLDHLTQDTSQ